MKDTHDFTREVFRRAADRRERSKRIRATVIPLAAVLVIAGIGGAVWLNRPGLTMIDAPLPESGIEEGKRQKEPAPETAGSPEDSRPAGDSTTIKATATATVTGDDHGTVVISSGGITVTEPSQLTTGDPAQTRTSGAYIPGQTVTSQKGASTTTTKAARAQTQATASPTKKGLAYSFNATITDLAGNTVTVEPDHDSREYQSASTLVFSLANTTELGVKVGDRIRIVYDGVILETYPAQIRVLQWKILNSDEP